MSILDAYRKLRRGVGYFGLAIIILVAMVHSTLVVWSRIAVHKLRNDD